MRANGMEKAKHKKRKSRRRNKRRPRIGDLPLSFGRYLGRPIAKVPRRYLRWAVSAVAQIPETDAWAIRKFLRVDSAENINATGDPVRPPVASP